MELRIITLIICSIKLRFRSHQSIEAENLALRQQLAKLKLKYQKSTQIGFWDRYIFVWLYRLCPSVLNAINIVQPSTVVRWHKEGFRACWRWKSHNNGGRPKIDRELRDLIRRISKENPLWGAPRIHGELLLLGYKLSQSTVANYIAKPPRNGGWQSWKTFLQNHRDGIASMDFVIVPTVLFKLLYCLIILNHAGRKIIHCAVATIPTARRVARQLIEAFPWNAAPALSDQDNDPVFNEFVRKRLRSIGDQRSPDSITIAVAERPFRAAQWLDPA